MATHEVVASNKLFSIYGVLSLTLFSACSQRRFQVSDVTYSSDEHGRSCISITGLLSPAKRIATLHPHVSLLRGLSVDYGSFADDIISCTPVIRTWLFRIPLHFKLKTIFL